MAAARPVRRRKGLDYAKLNAVGTTEPEDLEEGQIQDSPLQLTVSDDEAFMADGAMSAPVSSIPSARGSDMEDLLDYEDDLTDTISVSSSRSIQTLHHHKVEEVGDEDEDLGEQERVMKENEEKITKMKRKLERQKRMAVQCLKQEQQKMELARMEKEIKEIHQQRSVRNSNSKSLNEQAELNSHFVPKTMNNRKPVHNANNVTMKPGQVSGRAVKSIINEPQVLGSRMQWGERNRHNVNKRNRGRK